MAQIRAKASLKADGKILTEPLDTVVYQCGE